MAIFDKTDFGGGGGILGPKSQFIQFIHPKMILFICGFLITFYDLLVPKTVCGVCVLSTNWLAGLKWYMLELSGREGLWGCAGGLDVNGFQIIHPRIWTLIYSSKDLDFELFIQGFGFRTIHPRICISNYSSKDLNFELFIQGLGFQTIHPRIPRIAIIQLTKIIAVQSQGCKSVNISGFLDFSIPPFPISWENELRSNKLSICKFFYLTRIETPLTKLKR